MKILVPIKQVLDPDNANRVKVSADGAKVTGEGLAWKPNPFDSYALEAALRLNENGKPPAAKLGEVVAVMIAPRDATVTQTARHVLSMGADRVIHVVATDEALDSAVVARVLKALADKEKPDLLLLGKQAVDGDSNAAGQMTAEMLGWPMATFAMSIATSDGGKTLTVGREVDTGVLTVKVTAPAVVTVDLRIVASNAIKNGVTPPEHVYKEGIRFIPLKNINAVKDKKAEEIEIGALGVDAAPATKYSKFELPPARKGGVVFVQSAAELVQKLKTEAKVL